MNESKAILGCTTCRGVQRGKLALVWARRIHWILQWGLQPKSEIYLNLDQAISIQIMTVQSVL